MLWCHSARTQTLLSKAPTLIDPYSHNMKCVCVSEREKGREEERERARDRAREREQEREQERAQERGDIEK